MDELKAALANAGNKLVVIDFHAVWCGPCKRIAPAIEAMSKRNADVVFLKVDVDENSEASEKYGIEAMPTFKFVKNGKVVATITGADPVPIEAAVIQHK